MTKIIVGPCRVASIGEIFKKCEIERVDRVAAYSRQRLRIRGVEGYLNWTARVKTSLGEDGSRICRTNTKPPFDRWSVARLGSKNVGGRENWLSRVWAAESMGGREARKSDRRTPARSASCCAFLTTTAAFQPPYVDQIKTGNRTSPAWSSAPPYLSGYHPTNRSSWRQATGAN